MKCLLCALAGLALGVAATVGIAALLGSDWGEQEAHDQFLGAVRAYTEQKIAQEYSSTHTAVAGF